MAATELLCHLMGINPSNLSFQENLILEAELFIRICEELKGVFKTENREDPYLLYFHKENTMLEVRFLRYVINDILLTGEYSIEGIAVYTHIPEDLISDVVSGKNQTPSFELSRKIIELHRSVRPDLYKEVVKKITVDYLLMA
jgi:hypothetical protein